MKNVDEPARVVVTILETSLNYVVTLSYAVMYCLLRFLSLARRVNLFLEFERPLPPTWMRRYEQYCFLFVCVDHGFPRR